MKKRLFLSLLIMVLLVTGLFTACGTTTVTSTSTATQTSVSTVTTTTVTGTTGTTSTATTSTAQTTTTPSGPQWWDKFGEPKYGGTITQRFPSLDPVFCDPYYASGWSGINYMGTWLETPWTWSWTKDRSEFGYKTAFVTTDKVVGNLIESWEQPDPLTLNVKIREGIRWQDKPPANGREFTADDMVFHFNRVLGTGDGYTTPNPIFIGYVIQIAGVRATGKYTMEFKYKSESVVNLWELLCEQSPVMLMECPDVVRQYGDAKDWHNAVGTGPFILTDLVQNSSMTFVKNPNYWGYDERYPQNKLPYVDELKYLAIPDISAAISALRTGQLDFLTALDWRQTETIQDTNPEFSSFSTVYQGASVELNVAKEPFDDINVRTALDMALNRPQIAATYYNGTVSGEPTGIGDQNIPGWHTAFSEMPEDLQAELTYNPIKAKSMLREAGHPSINFTIISPSHQDQDILQIIKAQFADIGVDMDIEVKDPGSAYAYCKQNLHEAYYGSACGITWPPGVSVVFRHSTRSTRNFDNNKDPVFDALVESFAKAMTEEEARQIYLQVEVMALQQHWDINVFPFARFIVVSPHLKGYSGEIADHFNSGSWLLSRLWKD